MSSNTFASVRSSSPAAAPEAVIQCVRLLDATGVWFQLSRNHEAQSCRDAAHKRIRLGKEGIPLWDELKTFLGTYQTAADERRFVLAHTRADRLLDLEALTRVMAANGCIQRYTIDEFGSNDLGYGLMNPFTLGVPAGSTLARRSTLLEPITQVFDTDTVAPLGVPGTMMTNAGDFTWAVEFRPDELASRLADTVIAPISIPDPDAEPRLPALIERRPIGIITGNGPETGIIFWNKLNGHVRSLLGERSTGDLSMPRILMLSLPEMGLSMELDRRRDAVWSAIREAVLQLMDAGARFIALPDNTTPYFAADIRALCTPRGVEFMSMPEATGQWLKANRLTNIALVGIRYVTELDGSWSAYKEVLQGFDVETVEPRVLDQIHEIAYRVKDEGVSSTYGLNRLRDILSREVKADVVVLALTELSILLDRAKFVRKGKTLVDPISIYAEAVARRYLSLPSP